MTVALPITHFKTFTSTTGEQFRIPAGLDLATPARTQIDQRHQNFLIYIPWNNDYLRLVPKEYEQFFTFVLPQLGARTTDVHVATCLPFVKKLGQMLGTPYDARIVYAAFILHDIGWSQLSETEVAESLGVTGLALTKTAQGPKEKHAIVGRDLARQVLDTFVFDPPLTAAQKGLILNAVLLHDKPWELAANNEIPVEMKMVCDVDHLWSFTPENFWQDTVRKNVKPEAYAANLQNDLDGYFITEQAKRLAADMLTERRREIEASQSQ